LFKKDDFGVDKILKATADDIRGYIRNAIREKFEEDGKYTWLTDYEPDEGFAYFSEDYWDGDKYITNTYRVSYTRDGVNITIGDDLSKVVRETKYTEVKDDDFVGKTLLKSIKGLFDEYFQKKDNKEFVIIKQFDDEEMIAIEPMYCPPMVEDGHGESMDMDTIYKMVESANKAIQERRLSGGLFHKMNTPDIEILKTWVNECPCKIGDTDVVEGQPIAKVKFHNEELWEMRKNGELKGLSIGAKGKKVEVVND
jgi:hypothetical protein